MGTVGHDGRRAPAPFGINNGSMPDSEEFDARLVRTFLPQAGVQVDESVWPASVPAMAQLLREGLELPAGPRTTVSSRPIPGSLSLTRNDLARTEPLVTC